MYVSSQSYSHFKGPKTNHKWEDKYYRKGDDLNNVNEIVSVFLWNVRHTESTESKV